MGDFPQGLVAWMRWFGSLLSLGTPLLGPRHGTEPGSLICAPREQSWPPMATGLWKEWSVSSCAWEKAWMSPSWISLHKSPWIELWVLCGKGCLCYRGHHCPGQLGGIPWQGWRCSTRLCHCCCIKTQVALVSWGCFWDQQKTLAYC